MAQTLTVNISTKIPLSKIFISFLYQFDLIERGPVVTFDRSALVCLSVCLCVMQLRPVVVKYGFMEPCPRLAFVLVGTFYLTSISR